MSVTAFRDCNATEGICGSDQTETTVYNSQGEQTVSVLGRMRLSPNGTWGIVTSGNVRFPSQFVINLATGEKYNFASRPYDNLGRGHAVANDGTAVASGGALVIFRPPDQSQVVAAKPDSATIDAEATTVVWAEGAPGSRSLRVLPLSSGAVPLSLAVSGRDEFSPYISNDGKRILFLSRRLDNDDPQVFVIRPDGSERRQITFEAEGIQSAVLAGNGTVVWAVTKTGRLIRIAVDSGAVFELIGHSPAILTKATSAAIGSALTVNASVTAGESVCVQIDGKPAPVIAASNGSVTFQVPWELDPYQSYAVGLQAETTGDWVGGATMQFFASPTMPWFLRAPGSELNALAVHQDWGALVTPDLPAKPGEIIHFYATGLGPVSPPVSTGTPAPVSPSLVTSPTRCYIPYGASPKDLPIDLLYAGLAPGTIGYYLISVRLPQTLNPEYFSVNCALQWPGFGEMTFGAYLPVTR